MAKKALVTGGSKGIGAAIAEILTENGYQVTINYNQSEKEAKSLSKKLGCNAIKADLSLPLEIGNMFASVGELDLLVNNAGISHHGLLTDISLIDWQRIFTINTQSAFLCSRAAIPAMVKNKSGNIINISSMWGRVGASCEAAYSSSKAALIGLTKSLAKELGPSGIRVNCIAPGVIDTDMIKDLSKSDKEELIGETPLCRLGTCKDVAELCLFLSSEKAGFITGQVIGVDGGFVM